jgi:hypothetical protein
MIMTCIYLWVLCNMTRIIIGTKATFPYIVKRIVGVMVSVLASSAVYHRLETRSGQMKNYEIGICCFSAKYTELRRKSKD